MSRLAHILTAVGVLAGIAGLRLLIGVLEHEYDYWAPRVADRLIRVAALFLPHAEREERREEWLAELAEARAQGGVLTFALFEVLPGAPVLAARSLWRGTDWIGAAELGVAYGLGVGVSAVGVGLGAWLGALHSGTQLGAALGVAVGLSPGLWVAAVLSDRRIAGLATEHGAQLGAVLGFWLGAVYGIVGGDGLAAFIGVGCGPVLGGALGAWSAAALKAWLGGAPATRSADAGTRSAA
ncbi:MAG: hypothetical protein ACRD0K_23825 [Egibacteraceae bacterium]